MKRKVTVVLLALAAALLLGLSVFFVACDVGTESGGQNTEQGGTGEEPGGETGGENEGETGEEGGTGNEKPTLGPDVSDKLEFELFHLHDGSYYIVTGMDTSAAGSVTIPTTYNGLPVTSIGLYAFEDCSSLTGVTIGNNVESIGSHAFYNCSSLAEVTIGAGVTSIGYGAFHGCSSLTEIVIPDSVTSIGSYAFYGCSSLTEIVVPDSVTSIGSYAFEDCSSLAEVTIGAGVTSIADEAFSGCSSLTEIVVPDSVTSIGSSAFYGCSSLTEIVVPDSVTSIGSSAFYGCSSLTEIVIPDSVTSIGSYAFEDCTELTGVTIGAGVTSIGRRAFYNCPKLIEVYNQSVLDITVGSNENGYVAYYAQRVYTQEESDSWFTDTAEGYRFYYDGSKGYLMGYYGAETALTLPAGFTAYDETEVPEYEIYTYAFYMCDSLKSVVIPDSVTSIGSSAFYGCSSLTGITIPASVASIGDEAFYGCSSLTGITIPASVASIGDEAFYRCSNLTEINYNAAAVADLIGSAFYDAGSDSEECMVTFGESVTSIPAYLFRYANITSVTIGSNVESIGSSAFENCSSLTEITISESVTSIGSDAFAHCSGLTEITIPEGVTSIGWNAFSGCSGLTEINFNAAAIADCDSGVFNGAGSNSDGITVVFGENVTSIPAQLFSDENITSVTIGAGVTSIGSWAFHGCSNLTEINYNAAAVADLSYDRNVFYNAGSNSDGITVTFGESVKSIPAYLFCAYSHYDHDYYSANIVNVTIGSNVESIGSYAFAYCSGLTEVTIGAGVTSIGSYAFRDCSNLTEINYNAAVVADLSHSSYVFYNVGSNSDGITVTFGESVTSIPAYLFENASANITSVTIGGNVESIGSSAFYNCSNLASVTIGEGVTSIGDGAFYRCSNLTEINYNAAAVADLTSSSNVFYNAGSNSDGITVTFGESVTSIPAYLFYTYTSYVPNLVSVTIGSNVERIGSSAFRDCSNLAEITISEGVTSIGSNAFRGCSNFAEITIPASVTSIGSYAFAYCSNLMKINYNAADVADWTSASNVFRGAGSNSGGIAVTFGESVTSIPAFLFYDSSHLVNVTIGSNVESIGDSAFRGCSSLTEVTIPKGVTSIGNNAFCECSNLASVTIPDSVTIIGIWAFAFCSKLTSVTFEITEGWWRSKDSTATSGTEIASSDLANPSTAATYLKSTYIGSYWRRS